LEREEEYSSTGEEEREGARVALLEERGGREEGPSWGRREETSTCCDFPIRSCGMTKFVDTWFPESEITFPSMNATFPFTVTRNTEPTPEIFFTCSSSFPGGGTKWALQ
jgi:hypothetical protein